MKLERMLSIITYLLNHQKVKAQELADKFEVSVRTIYRDVDAISMAGIPITTFQGVDGGIGIVDGYKLDKSVFTSDDMTKIIAGLKGLQSISEDTKIKMLIERLTGIANKSDCIPAGNEIVIDLSSWNKNDKLGFCIKEIKKAIQERRIIEFNYFGFEEKQTVRKAEPYVLVFKEANWYLYAFCLLRMDFRLFKLRRINNMYITDDVFERREVYLEKIGMDQAYDKDIHPAITVLFDKALYNTVNDTFGVDSYETVEDGRLKVTFHMDLNRWLYGFLLGFGDKVDIVEPAELKTKLKDIAEGVYKKY
ncbi:MAG: YafY family protein [Bacillota bacterium]|nr:YafY family protein [Bacillota bacterium]